MTSEMYRYIFLATLIASCLMAVLSVVLFFVLNIPKIIGDLSGRTARKAIADIRKQNEESGDKTFGTSEVNRERGKLTDKISPSGRLEPRGDNPFGTGKITEQLSGEQLGSNETTVLGGANETTVLGGAGETTVLSAAPAAVPENQVYPVQSPAQPAVQQTFTVEYEIVYIHTNEVIA